MEDDRFGTVDTLECLWSKNRTLVQKVGRIADFGT